MKERAQAFVEQLKSVGLLAEKDVRNAEAIARNHFDQFEQDVLKKVESPSGLIAVCFICIAAGFSLGLAVSCFF